MHKHFVGCAADATASVEVEQVRPDIPSVPSRHSPLLKHIYSIFWKNAHRMLCSTSFPSLLHKTKKSNAIYLKPFFSIWNISFQLLQHTCYYLFAQITDISTIPRSVKYLQVDVNILQLQVVSPSICDQLFLRNLSNFQPTPPHYFPLAPKQDSFSSLFFSFWAWLLRGFTKHKLQVLTKRSSFLLQTLFSSFQYYLADHCRALDNGWRVWISDSFYSMGCRTRTKCDDIFLFRCCSWRKAEDIVILILILMPEEGVQKT